MSTVADIVTNDSRAVHWAARLLGVMSAVILFAMMSLTFVDVWGRYIFNAPIPGGFEITELMMAALIFAGLPLTTLYDEHITVDLLDKLFPRAVARVRDALIGLACGGMMGVLAYRLWFKAVEQVSYGDQTAALYIPVAPVTFFMSVSCAFSCILFAILAWHRMKGTPTA